jgi:hypothetical protein
MNFAAFSAWRNSAEGFVLVFFAGIFANPGKERFLVASLLGMTNA